MHDNDGVREPELSIRAASCGRCIASWRSSLLLPRGRYEFRAVMTSTEVSAAHTHNSGAGIRISGARRKRILEGTVKDRPQVFTFDVQQKKKKVVFVLELRATRGSVSFRKNSLRLLRMPAPPHLIEGLTTWPFILPKNWLPKN